MQYDGRDPEMAHCKGTDCHPLTNPCSEYVFLNNTALQPGVVESDEIQTLVEDGKFDVERFKAAVRIFITAQEIIVDNASYPT